MAGQNAEVALGAGNLQFVDVLVNDRAIGSNDNEFESTFSHA
jgi:hypothetical protein